MKTISKGLMIVLMSFLVMSCSDKADKGVNVKTIARGTNPTANGANPTYNNSQLSGYLVGKSDTLLTFQQRVSKYFDLFGVGSDIGSIAIDPSASSSGTGIRVTTVLDSQGQLNCSAGNALNFNPSSSTLSLEFWDDKAVRDQAGVYTVNYTMTNGSVKNVTSQNGYPPLFASFKDEFGKSEVILEGFYDNTTFWGYLSYRGLNSSSQYINLGYFYIDSRTALGCR